MSVVFSNPGLAELPALTTMGVSVKEGLTPIGFFGTGFKYALATLLRSNTKVHLLLGEARIDFFLQLTTIRGQEFDVVWMRKDEVETCLNFTTQLGRNWEMWQALRELHSNALDEGGDSRIQGEVFPNPGDTQIVVTGEDFERTYVKSKDRVFLPSRPTWVLDGVEVHRVTESFAVGGGIYYRGVIVATPPNLLYNYNILSPIKLSEDRAAASLDEVRTVIGSAIAKSNEKVLMETIIARAKEETAGENAFYYGYSPSEIFLDLIEVPYLAGHKLTEQLVSLLKLRRKKHTKRVPADIDELAELTKSRAEEFLMKLGYPIEDIVYYPVKVSHEMVERDVDRGFAIDIAAFSSPSLLVSRLLYALAIKLGASYDTEAWLKEQIIHIGQRYLKEVL